MGALYRVFAFVVAILLAVNPHPSNRVFAFADPTPTQAPALVAELDRSIQPGAFVPQKPIIIHFNQPVKKNSSPFPVLTDPFLAGSTAWSEGDTTLTFSPEGGFQPGMTYQVYLDPALTGADGATFSETPYWTLHMLNAPRLVRIEPGSGTLNTLNPVIQLAFDQPMDAKSVAGGLSMEPAATPYQSRWNGNTLEIRFEIPLVMGQQYRFTLSGSATNAQGIPLGEDTHWDYWIDSFRASVFQVEYNKVQLVFNYPVDRALSGLPFEIQPEVKGTWKWESDRIAQFTPEKPLPAATEQFTVSFTGPLKAAQGLDYPMPEPVSFASPDAIREHGPFGPEWVYEEKPAIWMDFNRPVDKKSVEAAFSVKPTVKGHLSWAKDRLTFLPDELLESGLEYTVTVAASALDEAGQAMLAEPFSWKFRIAQGFYNSNDVSFGQYGANAQVLDARGRRAVQFINGDAKGKPAIFNLYRIKPDGFAAYFQKNFKVKYYYGPYEPVDSSGLEKLNTWPLEKGDDIQETNLPDGLPVGTYLLTTGTSEGVSDELFIIITDYKLVLKTSGERIWVWATTFDGKNADGLHLRMYAENGSILREGDTDSDGIFSTSQPKEGAIQLVTALSEDGDLTVGGTESEWGRDSENYDWWSPWTNTGSPRYYRGYLYTERPIYRPGQEIFYKGVLRGDDDIHYTLPKEGTPVQVRLLDARGNEVLREDKTLNAFGTFNGAFSLAEGAMLGEYTIEATVKDYAFTQIFQVQEYRKPEYRVDLSMETVDYTIGDLVKVAVDTQYYFGQPVSGANISAVLVQLLPKGQYWWEDIDFNTGSTDPGDYTWYSQIKTLPGTATTADGKANLSFYAEYQTYNCSQSWKTSLAVCYLGLQVTATDASGQAVTSSKVIRVYNAPVKYTISAGSWVKRPGESFTITAGSTNIEKQPVKDHEVKIILRGYGNYWNPVNVSTQVVKTDAEGKITLPFTIEKEGYYEIALVDPKYSNDYHPVEAGDWVYVTGKARQWSQESYGNFSIKAEKREYQPYEKAKLMITSPFNGPALLTFERGQIIHTRPVMLTAPLTEVEVDIIPEDAPNIYVVVNAWRQEYQTLENALKDLPEYYSLQSLSDARLYRAEVELQVDAGANRLNVSIEPDKESYGPREEASFTVRVTNAQNKPARSEISLALVDEAIYALADDYSGSIFTAFYGRREHSIATFNSLGLNRWLYDMSGRGGGGGGEDVAPASPRSNFQDTAVWLPEIRTDEKGEAVVKVSLPDNLTSWRVVVKAVSTGSLVGENTINILTQKDLVVRPSLPTQLVAGDTLSLLAVVHNYAQAERSLVVSLSTGGLSLQGDASRTLALKAGESQPVIWPVTAQAAGEVTITIRAVAKDGAEDSVQLTLPVLERSIPDIASRVGDFTGDATEVIFLPPDLLPSSTVELVLSRSIGGSMLEGLEYLTGYPYGCVEQTMSRALPNAVVGRALEKLGVQETGLAAQLPELINAGLQRLYGYQHADGGWGWWYDDETDGYQTAWVVFGLAVTRDAGYAVDEDVIQRGAEYLKTSLEDEATDIRTRAYMLYSLATAGYASREQALALLNNLYELDSFSQAGLALALHALGEEEQARKVLDLLDSTVLEENGEAYWSGDRTDGQYHSKTMSSPVRTTALGLSAYLQIAPSHERIPQLVRYLMARRGMNGWGTTNETAYTLLALTDYLRLAQEEEGDLDYQVSINDEKILGGTLPPGAAPLTIPLPVDRMKAGPNRVQITQNGAGRLYYTLTRRLFRDLPVVEPSGTLVVTREYVDAKTGRPLDIIEAGELVRVKLTVTGSGQPISYALIEDHLPAGLEAINENLNNSALDASQKHYDYDVEGWVADDFFQWQQLGYNNKEIRGGRVTFFVTTLSGNSKTFTYLARATQQGSFTALPAEAYAMYDLAVWGRSGSGAIEVK